MQARPLVPGTPLTPEPPQGGLRKHTSQSYSLEVGPDGVKVEISEDVDGKQEKKTYTAKTLDELYQAHPELREKLGMNLEFRSGPMGGLDSLGREPFWSDFFGERARPDPAERPARPLQGAGPRTDILGVHIGSLEAEEQEKAKLDDGVGLKVAGVEPGTIAARIGVREGDILVEVNGRTVRSVDDVRGALRERKAGEDVSVTVVEDGGARRTLTWRAQNVEEKGSGAGAGEARRF
jgi:hypothetical protein